MSSTTASPQRPQQQSTPLSPSSPHKQQQEQQQPQLPQQQQQQQHHDSDNDHEEEQQQEQQEEQQQHDEVKHMLNDEWTLWFDHPKSKSNEKNYGSSLDAVISFQSVEEFWSVFNYVVKASQLKVGTTYRLFKSSTGTPAWENPLYKAGGEWLLPIKAGTRHVGNVDDLWKLLCMACIGEAFEHGDHLVGCSFAVRKSEYKISIWTSTSDKNIATAFGHELRNYLNLPVDLKIFFKTFAQMSTASYDVEIVL